jgi:hypothetical protein
MIYVPVYPHAVYSDDWDGPGESQFGTLWHLNSVSRSQACRILAARHEPKLKSKEADIDQTIHKSTSIFRRPSIFSTHMVFVSKSVETAIVLVTRSVFFHLRQDGRKPLSSSSLWQMLTAIHLQPGSTSKRPKTNVLAMSCVIWNLN